MNNVKNYKMSKIVDILLDEIKKRGYTIARFSKETGVPGGAQYLCAAPLAVGLPPVLRLDNGGKKITGI